MKNLNLKAEIIRQFGTQGALAEKLGWDQAKLSLIVNGWLPPERDRKVLAEVLGVEQDIFGRTENKN